MRVGEAKDSSSLFVLSFTDGDLVILKSGARAQASAIRLRARHGAMFDSIQVRSMLQLARGKNSVRVL